MITIDSQIWIYYWDSNALEHENVSKWMQGTERDGILYRDKIVLSSIIPIEMGHNLYRLAHLRKGLDKETIADLLLTFISTENYQIIDIDNIILVDVLQKMKDLIHLGIGGRDALILTTMDRLKVSTIATHDKNILKLIKYKRIDPVFKSPLILNVGDEFDEEVFGKKLKNL